MKLLIKRYAIWRYALHFALSLGIIWLCSPAYAQIVTSSPQVGVRVDAQKGSGPKLVDSPDMILPELAQADVVYLGETHDNPQDHQIQLEIVQKLYQRNPKIAIAMEMFQRPDQNVLNRYLAGQVSEQELLKQSEYDQRWGFPWKYYAPVVQFAKEKQLPVIALNTPTEVTRQVAREGLESLTLQQRQFIPPIAEIRTDNAEYRQLMAETFRQHHSVNHSADESRFFLAQVLWDETMAEGVAKFLQANPDSQVIVLAGQGHIIYNYGIPSRVARRMNNKLVQRSILLSPPEDVSPRGGNLIADFIWQQ